MNHAETGGQHRHQHGHRHENSTSRSEKSAGREAGKRVIHFECIGGASGDMCLGALIDLGCPAEHLRTELTRLGLDDRFDLTIDKKRVHGIVSTKATVRLTQEDVHGRGLTEISEIIKTSGLKETITGNALAVFRLLAEAEAAVHDVSVEEIHFHEVGAIDAIIDIVGTCIAIDYFGPEALTCGPLRTGTGLVRAAHGMLPVPAPAVVRLAEGRTLQYLAQQGELTTPTGAALLCALTREVDAIDLKVEHSGYGCGQRDFEHLPNLLRITLGRTT